MAEWDIPGTIYIHGLVDEQRECILTSCELEIIFSLALHWFKLSNKGVMGGLGWGIKNCTRAKPAS